MKINKTFQSKEGCIITIDGDLDFKLMPPKLIGFSGTITISGFEKCQNGIMHIEYEES